MRRFFLVSPRITISSGALSFKAWGLGVVMRTAVECLERAQECRRLSKLCSKPEAWAHFLEMAQTWDMLATQRQERLLRGETSALVLLLTKSAPEKQ
jgi:hypothetical protein